MTIVPSARTWLDAKRTRRGFLREGAASALAAAALTACRGRTADAVAAVAGVGAAGPAPTPPPPSPTAAADAMDDLCERGVKAFPAATEGKGNALLAHRMEGHVKVFELTCKKVQWETAPGQRTEAWTYNGIVPGP